jgi:HAE1 family hydrophobic/amphiphilic exporter-1
MIIGAMIVFGVVSFMRLGIDQFPKVDIPVITIVSKLPGADPETIESRVTDLIEEAVNTISGLKRLRSTSADSFSQVVIEFELDKNVDVAFQEVQARVNTIRQQLPTDLEEPVIDKLDLDSAPILTLVVSANMPIRDLSRLADKTVKERLQRVRNVGSAKLVGRRERKIWLWLNPEKMKQYNLCVQDVRAALQREHIEAPGGRVETGPLELTTRTKAEFQSAAEINDLIVVGPASVPAGRDAGPTIYLRDIGFVEDGLEEERSFAQLDETACIALQVRRQSGTNTVQVAHDVKAAIAKLKEELKPQGVRLEIAQDTSVYTEASVREVEHHLLVGGGMAVVTVLLFLLNFRSTFISALVLPTSVLSTFMMLNLMGFTLNMMTLMGLTLAIGLLIDDAIVVQENIMRHVQSGKPAHWAAEFATSEIGLAVLATTMSVVAVFVPVAMTRGIVGRFFWSFALTISFAVLISMFISFTMDPMLSSRLLRKHGKPRGLFGLLEKMFSGVEWIYENLLGFTLRHRFLVVLIGAGSLALAVWLVGFAKKEFVPVEDRSEFNVMVRAPQGASLERTRGIMERIRAQLKSVPEMRYTFYSIGADELQKVNEGTLYVKLCPKDARLQTQSQVMDVVRQKLAVITDAQISVQIVADVQGGGFKWAQLQYEIRGPELGALERISNTVIERMKDAGGFVDLQNSYEPNKPEADVVVDRVRASQLGIAPADVADTLRASIGGMNVGKFKAGGDRYDIAIRFLEEYRNRPELLAGLWVPSRKGGMAELSNVAKIVRTNIPVEISRYNRQRNVTVMANLGPGKVLGPAMRQVEAITAKIGLPDGYTAGWTGQGADMDESFGYLFETMVLSVIVVYMVLAAQFESLVHPFTIMLSLPLAFVGALAGLVIFNANVSIFAMIAFIFLLGLVTKNAILLIDYTNTLRERDGMARDDALRKAGPVRLRPILMTTVAMIAGMLPTAFGRGEGAESRQPMAIAIIGGLVTSTLLTLLVVPAVYSLLDPLSEFIRRRWLMLPESQVTEPKTPKEPSVLREAEVEK